MGKSILTSRQSQFLESIKENPEITRWFYLTGGTALSEFYLHHRLSDDIDLFSYSQVNDSKIDAILNSLKKTLGITNITKDHIMGLYIYKLKYDDGSSLKIDFNEYEFVQLEKSNTKYGSLNIDSYFDISVNKLYTIGGRFQTRDFIDLYLILQKGDFTINTLIDRVEDKFNIKIDNLILSNQLLRSLDLPPEYPKMFVPFDFEEMKKFFVKEARRLGNKNFV